MDEIRKDRNKKIDIINAEKKKFNKMKFDYEVGQKKIEKFDQVLRAKKKEIQQRGIDYDKVLIEKEKIQEELVEIHYNYDLGTIETTLKSAKRLKNGPICSWLSCNNISMLSSNI